MRPCFSLGVWQAREKNYTQWEFIVFRISFSQLFRKKVFARLNWFSYTFQWTFSQKNLKDCRRTTKVILNNLQNVIQFRRKKILDQISAMRGALSWIKIQSFRFNNVSMLGSNYFSKCFLSLISQIIALSSLENTISMQEKRSIEDWSWRVG